MKYSRKGTPPDSFVEWLGLRNEEWQPTYGTLSGRPLVDVRRSLLEEQEHLCTYCGRLLRDDLTDSHIDHFRPQARYNRASGDDRTLDYGNFALSCGPPDRNGMPSTCGDAKKDWFDPASFVEPWDDTCESRFVFGGRGRISPSDENDDGAATMIELLNLNDRALVAERIQLIAALETAIEDRRIDVDNYRAEIAKLKAGENGKRIGFAQVLVRYLEEELGDIGE